MDKDYWSEFYKNNNSNKKPSNFALYCFDNFFKKNNKVLELGCGNGRDSIFFDENKINVVAIDQCEDSCSEINKILSKRSVAYGGDFTKINNIENIKDIKFDYVYSRFTLHSITENEENRLFESLKEVLSENGKVMIEVRSVNDDIFGLGKKVSEFEYIYENHYRRFHVLKEMIRKFDSSGYRVLDAVEGINFAPHPVKEYNSLTIRMVLEVAV